MCLLSRCLETDCITPVFYCCVYGAVAWQCVDQIRYIPLTLHTFTISTVLRVTVLQIPERSASLCGGDCTWVGILVYTSLSRELKYNLATRDIRLRFAFPFYSKQPMLTYVSLFTSWDCTPRATTRQGIPGTAWRNVHLPLASSVFCYLLFVGAGIA
jgi:hypothetical protein